MGNNIALVKTIMDGLVNIIKVIGFKSKCCESSCSTTTEDDGSDVIYEDKTKDRYVGIKGLDGEFRYHDELDD